MPHPCCDDEPDQQPWEDEEVGEDPEGPQPCDLIDQDDDQTPTVPCPHCGRAVPDFTDRCPYCGDWIVQGGAGGASSRGVVFALVAVLVILALLYWLL